MGTILYYTILYYTILYYTILYYTILYYYYYYLSEAGDGEQCDLGVSDHCPGREFPGRQLPARTDQEGTRDVRVAERGRAAWRAVHAPRRQNVQRERTHRDSAWQVAELHCVSDGQSGSRPQSRTGKEDASHLRVCQIRGDQPFSRCRHHR